MRTWRMLPCRLRLRNDGGAGVHRDEEGERGTHVSERRLVLGDGGREIRIAAGGTRVDVVGAMAAALKRFRRGGGAVVTGDFLGCELTVLAILRQPYVIAKVNEYRRRCGLDTIEEIPVRFEDIGVAVS